MSDVERMAQRQFNGLKPLFDNGFCKKRSDAVVPTGVWFLVKMEKKRSGL
jgi:hypothetical protein